MGKAVAEITIDRPADDVWAHIGRYDDMFWHDGVETCQVDGDIRTVTMRGRPQMMIDHILIAHDDAGRVYSYGCHGYRGGEAVVKLPGGGQFDMNSLVGHHKATVAVAPVQGGAALVTYSVEIDDGYDAMLVHTRNGYEAVLKHLKHALEQ